MKLQCFFIKKNALQSTLQTINKKRNSNTFLYIFRCVFHVLAHDQNIGASTFRSRKTFLPHDIILNSVLILFITLTLNSNSNSKPPSQYN